LQINVDYILILKINPFGSLVWKPIYNNLKINGSIEMTQEITDDLHITGKVGIGIENPAEKLEVAGKVKATTFIGDAFIGDGSEIIALNGETIATLAKGWQEHINITSGNPHGTTAAQLIDYLNLEIVRFDFTHESPAGAALPQSLGFVPKLILISGGYTVSLGEESSYGNVVSGFWTKAQGSICSTFEVNKSDNDTAIIVGVTSSSFFTQGAVSGSSGTKRETLQGTIDFQESTKSLTVKLTKSKQPADDPLNEFTFNISLMMLCIG
jgi:hypothetical protein